MGQQGRSMVLTSVGRSVNVAAKGKFRFRGAPPHSQSVSVVGGDHNEGVVQLANLLEVLKSSSESVVEFEKITKRTVNVLDVHLLVDEL